MFVGDHRLSLMLSQAVGSQYCRDLLALQLSDWNRMQTDSFIDEERLKIFALLAGKPVSLRDVYAVFVEMSFLKPVFFVKVWQSTDFCINVCSELDWKRCVAVHLWYMLPPTASVADALAKYESAFQVLLQNSDFPSYALGLSLTLAFIAGFRGRK